MANWVIIFSWHEQDSREGKEQRWRGTRQIVLVFEGQCAAHSLPGTKTALRGGGWGQGEDLRGRSPVNISGLEKIPSFNCFSGTCMALDGHVSLASETHFPVAQTGDSIFFSLFPSP